ncbi:hypothetical protein CLOLEP_01935 [[Clostridium] leptum DSM 753]|uniref:Uncharacterized protein n=1 Tax=[Clostridium] leptum DSM 753 TaxID=428125 RepID=A7VTP2_9FIRM|nr:hypothetical protein CLOLEP_01935 [[Clostridium] leptum DSM 753]
MLCSTFQQKPRNNFRECFVHFLEKGTAPSSSVLRFWN